MGEWHDTLFGKVKGWRESSSVLLDVGAYQGDFTEEMLRTNWFEQAFLFECNPVNAEGLRQKFAAEQRVEVVPLAIGSDVGPRTFYCNADRATGSVLPYAQEGEARGQEVEQWHVEQTTLDRFAAGRLGARRVGLIKVDTQGNDLDVLKGAQELIQRHRPWIVIELLYVSMYEGQATPAEIFSWLAERGYGLGMQMLEHYTQEGWIAFADCVFVPTETLRNFTPQFHPRPETGALEQEVANYRAICDERLALIDRIHNEAAGEHAAVVRIQDEFMQLSAQCEAKEAEIHNLKDHYDRAMAEQQAKEAQIALIKGQLDDALAHLSAKDQEMRRLNGACDAEVAEAGKKESVIRPNDSKINDLWEQLVAKEAEIQRLGSACKERLELIEKLTTLCAEREMVIVKLNEMLEQRQKVVSA